MSDPNLFLLPAPDEPGRFTAALHALIHHVPAVGEVMASWLAESPAMEALFGESERACRFQCSEWHPHADPADRPDFALVCEGVEIQCAQTLTEEHAEAQLERYLLRRGDEGRVAVLALITRDPTPIPAAVVADPYFLRPPETEEGALSAPVGHHRWCSFHERLEGHPDTWEDPLVRDFLAYMDLQGMHPWRMGRWEDLFTHGASAQLMYGLWGEVKGALVDVATTFTRDSNGLGMVIKRPRPWLRKLSVVIEREASVHVAGIDLARPVITAQAWVGRARPRASGFASRRPASSIPWRGASPTRRPAGPPSGTTSSCSPACGTSRSTRCSSGTAERRSRGCPPSYAPCWSMRRAWQPATAVPNSASPSRSVLRWRGRRRSKEADG